MNNLRRATDHQRIMAELENEMNQYTRSITISIRVDDDSKLTNKELDNAFERIAEIIKVDIEENSVYMDSAQESIVNAEVIVIEVISPYSLLKENQ
jgi:hypothetical protein